MKQQDKLMEAMKKLELLPKHRRKEVARMGLTKGLLMAKYRDEKAKNRTG